MLCLLVDFSSSHLKPQSCVYHVFNILYQKISKPTTLSNFPPRQFFKKWFTDDSALPLYLINLLAMVKGPSFSSAKFCVLNLLQPTTILLNLKSSFQSQVCFDFSLLLSFLILQFLVYKLFLLVEYFNVFLWCAHWSAQRTTSITVNQT